MTMPDRMVRRTFKALRIGATSFLLTMSIFTDRPAGRVRPTYAIERTVADESDEAFDPREVIGGSVVLTLPLDAARPGVDVRPIFNRN